MQSKALQSAVSVKLSSKRRWCSE